MTMRFNRIELYAFAIALLGAALLPHAAEGACLSKPTTDRAGRLAKQHLIAPASEVARYQARGYVLEQCNVPLERLRQSVENVCRMAASAPASVQANVARSNGATPTELCLSGRAGLAEMQSSVNP
jgi:hypothetical protein